MLVPVTTTAMPTLATTSGRQEFFDVSPSDRFVIRCPEYDTYEGNKYTMAGTLHTCNGGGGYWDSCDRSGCQTNVYNLDSNIMCPEDRFPILTRL